MHILFLIQIFEEMKNKFLKKTTLIKEIIYYGYFNTMPSLAKKNGEKHCIIKNVDKKSWNLVTKIIVTSNKCHTFICLLSCFSV